MSRGEKRHGKRDGTMGRALSGVTLPDGMLSDMMTARCGMSCGHVLTNRQKTNMRKGKRRGERGE